MLTLAFSSPHTIESLLQETLSLLQKNFSEHAQNHAEWIIQDVFNFRNRAEIYLQRKNSISENQFQAVMSLARRHASGIPLQYVLGHTEFFSLKFEVGMGCLIPRPETEILVGKAIEWLQGLDQIEISVLDIGTGSGNISVCLAKYFKNVRIKAVDISPEALPWAQRNAKAQGVSHQIQFENLNGIDILKRGQTFDLIISNPPYISETDFQVLPAEIKDYEPVQALKSGRDGLNMIHDLIEFSGPALNQDGALIFEFGGKHQTEKIREIFDKFPEYESCRIFQDWAGKDRIAMAVKTSAVRTSQYA